MPRSRYRVQCDPYPHFLTATVNHWLPLFTRPETVNIILDSWRFLALVPKLQLSSLYTSHIESLSSFQGYDEIP